MLKKFHNIRYLVVGELDYSSMFVGETVFDGWMAGLIYYSVI